MGGGEVGEDSIFICNNQEKKKTNSQSQDDSYSSTWNSGFRGFVEQAAVWKTSLYFPQCSSLAQLFSFSLLGSSEAGI